MKARFPAPAPFWESGLSGAGLQPSVPSRQSYVCPQKLQVKMGAYVGGQLVSLSIHRMPGSLQRAACGR